MSSTPYKALSAFCDMAQGYVLNIGDTAESLHTEIIAKTHDVITIGLENGADIKEDYNTHVFEKPFGAIWCAHCLEHQRNVGAFLEKIFEDLEDGGLLCITVPPLKTNIVGGHLTLWNAGLVLYNIILAGFDCSDAQVLKDGYNITVMVNKKPALLPELSMDKGDIEKIAHFFPFEAKQGFDGNIERIGFDDYLQ